MPGLMWFQPAGCRCQMVKPLRTCCLSFLSRRFSFSVLPDFFDATFRGDLSAMPTPFPGTSVLACLGRRGQQEGGAAVTSVGGCASLKWFTGATDLLALLQPSVTHL